MITVIIIRKIGCYNKIYIKRSIKKRLNKCLRIINIYNLLIFARGKSRRKIILKGLRGIKDVLLNNTPDITKIIINYNIFKEYKGDIYLKYTVRYI